MDRLCPLSLSPLYGGGLLKRIRFFLKKYISVLVVIVLLITTVFSFSISASGKNLFNGTWEQGRLFNSGSVSSEVLFYITSSAVSLSPGTYIINVPSDFQVGYILFNSSGSPISNNLSYSSNYIQFTTTVNCSIRICLHRSNNNYLYPDDAPSVSLFENPYSVNYLDNISLVNLSYDELFESSQIYDHDSVPNIWYSGELVGETFHFDGGRMILDFSSSYNGIVEVGTYHCTFPFFFKPNGSSDITGTLNTVNYTFYFSDSVTHSGTCTFSNVDYLSGSLYSLIEFDLNISQASNDLFNNFKLQFDFYNASSDAASRIYWYGFRYSPSIVYNNPYASFEDDTISSVEGEVNNFIGGYSSQVEEYMDQFSNEWNIFLPQYEESLVGFKYIANKFFEHPWVYNVVAICIIAGVAPLFVRTFTRRRK